MNTYIVTLTWNNATDFARCAGSLEHSTYVPAQWVVVDNGSRPEERAAIKGRLDAIPRALIRPAEIRLAAFLTNPENRGLPAAQNQALDWIDEQENGQPYWVVLLDADTVVFDGWLSQMGLFAQQHPDVGIVGGAKSPQGTPCPVYHNPIGRWYVHDGQHLHPSGFMEGESVDFCCVLLRPELLARGLRFNEAYEIYDGHDQDMTFRVRSWGYRIWQIDAGVHHYASAVMKTNGYQWQGGGRTEWDDLRAKNVARFARIWKPFLASYRPTIEEEILHMRQMNEKLVAEAGDRKAVPAREAH